MGFDPREFKPRLVHYLSLVDFLVVEDSIKTSLFQVVLMLRDQPFQLHLGLVSSVGPPEKE